MDDTQKDAVVVLCKCGETHKAFGIRAEKVAPEHWELTWAFPIKESTAQREGYDHTSIGGYISISDEYPGCPYCGRKEFTVCSCDHLSCTILKRGMLTCEWCGSKGRPGVYTGERIIAGTDL